MAAGEAPTAAARRRRRRHLRRAPSVLLWLAALAALPAATVLQTGAYSGHAEKQRYDGWYNNLAHPAWGSADSRLVRKAPAAYADGVYSLAGQDRPSPRRLSELFLQGEEGLPSAANRTALFAFFGQLVTAEIMMASESGCPIEFHRIEVDRCDPVFDRDCQGGRHIPFLRADYDRRTGHSPNSPREQINKVTSWIDASFVYSSSEAWANTMRAFANGSFLAEPDRQLPVRNTMRAPLFNNALPNAMRSLDPERLYLLGDPRTNQHPPLLAFGILFHRWHNVLAARVQRDNPDMPDEEVFQRTRRIVAATLQNVIVYEYLPALLGEALPPYSGYKPDLHPGISHVFQSAAFRFGHTMIPPGIYRRDEQCNFRKGYAGQPAIRLCTTWWDSNEILADGSVEELLMGLASQLAEREDSVLSPDIRNSLFGPMEFSLRDLGALNIMRGRDNGLPDYNTARLRFGLPKRTSWNDINPGLFKRNPELLRRLMESHANDLNNVDLYLGGMLESAGGPGELFAAVIREQFARLRDADRFWFENTESGLFTRSEIEDIRRVRLWDIVTNATSIAPGAVQRDLFTWREGDPCPQPLQLNSSMLEPCMPLQRYDYFEGSIFVYIYACIFLCFVPIVCAGAGYGLVKLQNRRRRRLRLLQEGRDGKEGCVDKMVVREWIHANCRRLVKVKFGSEPALYVLDRKGQVLRTFAFHEAERVRIEQSAEPEPRAKCLLLLRVPSDYDLVLQLDSSSLRRKFVAKLEAFLLAHGKRLVSQQRPREQLLAGAETKERRERKLEEFFREAYALTFFRGEQAAPAAGEARGAAVMSTSLSKSEFASALGMKPDAMFVKKMFRIVDKDGDGRISFVEFLQTVSLFSRGRPDDKLRIFFDMCDQDGDGLIDKAELSEMLRSLVEIVRTTSVSEEHVTELIEGMFEAAGLQRKGSLTYADFKLIMKEYKGDFGTIGLDCKGAKQTFIRRPSGTANAGSAAAGVAAGLGGSEGSCPPGPGCWALRRWRGLTTVLEENRQNIFYLFIFYVATIALFVERFIYYSFMSEHTDLRHIMGLGIAVTRGSAAALSFCYSLLLLTMCRNLLTKLKELSVQQYIPLDAHVQFHKVVACTAGFFSVLHSVGHVVNFYHLSSQPLLHLQCLSGELRFPSDARPTISYWLFQTLTGLTGILLFLLMSIIFVFSHPTVRRRAYGFFWRTHSLYSLLYALSLVHGLARLTGSPRFWAFFVGPAALFAVDKIVSLRTRYMALDILETELLPSDVIRLKFYRPPNLRYASGQWVRLACSALRSGEFHSFTLTSAPHENFLACHIKAQGPWTWRLRNFFDPANYERDERPEAAKVRIEGPFGGGNQDWYKFEVAVMVGGGIGVTPYASILNDLVFGTSTNRYSGVACKKVYFLWICPSHKYFEWFIEVLRDVERKDVTSVLEIHIFITQFFHKFDLRTTMLYICENHFHRVANASIFTGLKAVNHFGRPDMPSFLRFVQKKHSYVSKIGVFSCGPRPLTKSVMSACDEVNKERRLPYYIHHFENFG